MSLNDQDRRYNEPSFQSFEDVPSEAGVQSAFLQNVLQNLRSFVRDRHPKEKFNFPGAATEMKGKPDFICQRTRGTDSLLVIFEMKTKWILPGSPDLVAKYNRFPKDNRIQRSVEQIYGYVHLNNLRYGVLSAYDVSWFIDVSDNGKLYISSPIKFDDTNPSLLQSLASKARDNPFRGPPPQPPNPPDNSTEDKDGADSTRKRKWDGPFKNTRNQQRKRETDGKHHSVGIQTIEVGPLDIYEFQLMNYLGRGRSGTVFRTYWRGEEVALKLCDIAQQPEYEEELMAEVEVYNNLKELQGRCIPRLVTAGYDGYLFFAIATEIVGSPVKVDQLNRSKRWEIVGALSEIHRRGFLHNDIREENILIQRGKDGFKATFKFIDFAFSKRTRDKRRFRKEMACLKELLGLDKAAKMPSRNSFS